MDFIITGFGSRERLASFRRGFFFLGLVDRREWEEWVVVLEAVKLEGDGSSMAVLDFARGVFSTSSVALDECSTCSHWRRFKGEELRVDMSFVLSLMCDLFRLPLHAADSGGEGACESQEETESWPASKDNVRD
jgi:hypothetical protein